MASQTLAVSFIGDAGKLVSEFGQAGDAAKTMGDDMDRASRDVKELGDRMGDGASKSSQFVGGIGDIGGALAGVNGPLGTLGSTLETTTPFLMGAVGAFDLMELAANSTALAWVKNAAAMVGQKVALVASTVATGAATAAQWLFNAALNANPIGLIVVGIVLLITTVGLLIKNWDKVKSFLLATWGVIKSAFNATWTWMKTAFSTVLNAIRSIATSVWGGIKAVFSGAFSVIRGAASAFMSGLRGIWSGITYLWTKAQEVVGRLVGIMSGIKGRVMGAISGAMGWLREVGRDIMRGLVNGIESGLSWVRDKVSGLGNVIPGWLRDVLGISSPSRVMAEIGRQTIDGFAQGFTSISGKDIVNGLASDIASVQPALNATVDGRQLAGSGGGTVIHVTVNVPPTADKAEVGRAIEDVLFERFKVAGHFRWAA